MRRSISVWSRWAALGGLLLLAACSSKGKSAAPAPGEQQGVHPLEIADELKVGLVRHSRERAREIALGKAARTHGRHAEGRGGAIDEE